MNLKEGKNRVKAYFIIVNLVLATVAFAYIIGGVEMVSGQAEGLSLPAANFGGGDAISKILGLPGSGSLTPIGASSEQVAVEAAKKAATDEVAKKAAEEATKCTGLFCFVTKALSSQLISNLMVASLIGAGGALVGNFLGGNGALAGGIAGFTGTMAFYIMKDVSFKTYGSLGRVVQGVFGPKGTLGLGPLPFGIIVGATIFILMYKKEKQEIVEFNCNPWEAPTGGADCELCNKNSFVECSEYRCKSLGQACGLIPENIGTNESACVWMNPYDVNSPMIKIGEVTEGYTYKPDSAVRPPATGVVIEKQGGGCVEAFTPLEFTFMTDEPAQCKIDYNLTSGDTKLKISAYDEMSYYVGGTNHYSYNHTEKMSLPGPAALNAAAPELKNDGTYTLYVRCRDANGNFNQDAFSARFCVNPGPDSTPPKIESVSIPSNSPIQFNKSSVGIEVYVNEPAECKWSRENRDYSNMEYNMSCSTNVWEMNNNNVYTCAVTLTGLESRKINDFYFRCKDKPWEEEKNRNVNTQSFKYVLIGTQPLTILNVGPNETIKGATDTIPVYLTIKTDNGYNNGEAACYYSTTGKEADYIQFLTTGTNAHEQRQDLKGGNYTYYFKCVDLGGNAAYSFTKFYVAVDRGAPTIIRIYNEGQSLKIITNEKSICSYSAKDCNFNIEDGIAMPYDNDAVHTAEWKVTQKYYIRCKDEYNNQPNPNSCSVIAKPYDLLESGGVVEL